MQLCVVNDINYLSIVGPTFTARRYAKRSIYFVIALQCVRSFVTFMRCVETRGALDPEFSDPAGFGSGPIHIVFALLTYRLNVRFSCTWQSMINFPRC